MKTFHITKHNFLDFYFEENYTEESAELRLDLANKVIDLLIKKGDAVITTEEIFNDCNHESIKLSYLEEFKDDEEIEGELSDIKFEYNLILIE